MSAPAHLMVILNAIAVALLLWTAARVPADTVNAVAYAIILLCLFVNVGHNIVRIVMRRRALSRRRESNGI